jgi:hypothetical protein
MKYKIFATSSLEEINLNLVNLRFVFDFVDNVCPKMCGQVVWCLRLFLSIDV